MEPERIEASRDRFCYLEVSRMERSPFINVEMGAEYAMGVALTAAEARRLAASLLMFAEEAEKQA